MSYTPRVIERTGRRYGKWLVLRRDTERKSPSRVTFWWVRCACGFEASRAASNLDSGHSTRCRGCANKERGRRIADARAERRREREQRVAEARRRLGMAP